MYVVHDYGPLKINRRKCMSKSKSLQVCEQRRETVVWSLIPCLHQVSLDFLRPDSAFTYSSRFTCVSLEAAISIAWKGTRITAFSCNETLPSSQRFVLFTKKISLITSLVYKLHNNNVARTVLQAYLLCDLWSDHCISAFTNQRKLLTRHWYLH